MATKKPRNKKYRPRPVAQHGGLIAVARAHIRAEDAMPLVQDQTTDLGVAYWLAFENLRTGTASEESWSVMVCSLNVAVVLAEKGIGADYEEDLVLALDGAFRAKVRGDAGKSFRLDGQAMQDIERALHVHDEQMKIATRAEVINAMRVIRKRLDDGNVYKVAA